MPETPDRLPCSLFYVDPFWIFVAQFVRATVLSLAHGKTRAKC